MKIRSTNTRRGIGISTFAAILATVVMISSTAMAAWTATGHTINRLTMSGNFKVEILEDYKEPESLRPGEEITKVVEVKNSGDIDCFVRVWINKGFGVYDEDGVFIKDENLDDDMIEIDFNTNSWEQHVDGYWYYKDILRAHSKTAEPLMNSFIVNPNTGNEYKGKHGEIIVTVETIQAEGPAMEELWGVTAEELGITATPNIPNEDTYVRFISSKKGFKFNAKDGDLFANFKNLTPGCLRTQYIYVTNESDVPVEMFLRAEVTQQDQMSDMQKTLVKKLLSKYAVIDIQNGTELLYSGTVDGNVTSDGGLDSMAKNISIGEFDAGETKEYVVNLSLDNAMDNNNLDLVGKVGWLFTAKELKQKIEKVREPRDDEDEGYEYWEYYKNPNQTGTPVNPANPDGATSKYPSVVQTGDTSPINILVVGFAVGLGLLLIAVVTRRRIS